MNINYSLSFSLKKLYNRYYLHNTKLILKNIGKSYPIIQKISFHMKYCKKNANLASKKRQTIANAKKNQLANDVKKDCSAFVNTPSVFTAAN